MTKVSELREMSDEQLRAAAEGDDGPLVPPAAASADRAAGRPQRTAQAAAADRADQDHPAASERPPGGRQAAKSSTERIAESSMPKRVEIGIVTSDKTAKTRRVEIPRLVQASPVRQEPPPPDGLHRPRREQRVARRRQGGDRRMPADVAHQAMDSWCGWSRGARAHRPGRRSRRRRGRERGPSRTPNPVTDTQRTTSTMP